ARRADRGRPLCRLAPPAARAPRLHHRGAAARGRRAAPFGRRMKEGRAMTAALSLPTSAAPPAGDWAECRFLTCSVLPVRAACTCRCPFCSRRSPFGALRHEPAGWDRLDVEDYYRFARDRGATRLVVTGGGEPLLRPDDVVRLVALGRRHFG